MKTSDYLIKPGKRVKLSSFDPNDNGGIEDKDAGREILKDNLKELGDLQEVLYAEHKQSLLVVVQALDTGGKDGMIENVFTGMNPAGVTVTSFKVPTPLEASHDFLWRYHAAAPAQGTVAVFNRSHYEDVLAVRVRNLVDKKVWQGRYDLINDFEKLLAANGTRIVKLYLYISKDEQKERLQARIDEPDKNWKFNVGDLDDRALWDDYQKAFEDALTKCSTDVAPWYVIPANRKWFRDALVSTILVETLKEMKPKFPESTEDLSTVVIED